MNLIIKTLINRILYQPIKTIITLISIILGVMIVTICLNINNKLESFTNNKNSKRIINILSGKQNENNYDFDGLEVINDYIISNIKVDFPEINSFSKIKESSSNFIYQNDYYRFGIAISADSDFITNNNLDLLYGSNFLEESNNIEILISDEASNIIFQNENPIGKELNIVQFDWDKDTKSRSNSIKPSKIVGVYKSVDGFTKLQKGFPDIISSYNSSEILGYLSLNVDTKTPELFISKLNQYFKNEFGEDRNFIIWEGHILSPYDESEWFTESANMMIIFFTILGGVTLIVSSFSVFSMVMISVAERGREIGLKRALGCNKLSIIIMFFLESAIFIFLAAIPGVFLAGLFFPVVLDGTLPSITGGSIDLSASISRNMEFLPIFKSVSITMLLGAVAGIFPSLTSVNVLPIENIKET